MIMSQAYLSLLALLLSLLNTAKASDVENDNDNEYEESGAQRSERALKFILAYVVLTLCFVICIYLRHKMCKKGMEGEGESAAEYEYSITIAATKKLDARVIESFPKITFPHSDGKFHFTDCHICLEEFKQGESLVMLPTCSHAYHNDCIHRWMATKSSCCPDCRHDYGSIVLDPHV